jgi:predicted aspartyl protease
MRQKKPKASSRCHPQLFGIYEDAANIGASVLRLENFPHAIHVGCKLENHIDRKQTVTVPRALVDTGSEYTWIPSKTLEKIGVNREKKDLVFMMANGQTITRSVGFAILRVDKLFTIDEVVFAEPVDMTLLGARTLEGLSLAVDPRKKRLVAAGPLPAAGNQA